MNDNEIYTCEFCGFSEGWEESDFVHGDMWGCEKCGKAFCSKCLRDAIGADNYKQMMQSGELILCSNRYNASKSN